MYSILVVDDEKYAVLGMTQSIEWDEVGVSDIYTAYNVSQAKEVVQTAKIDVIVCDIEMPEENGIQLLGWVKAQYPEIRVVILTGHADFSYAQRAIQLGASDYLLKPYEHDELKEVVQNLLNEIQDERERAHYYATYKKYSGLWEKQLPILIEKFWQDILSQRVIATTDTLGKVSQIYNLPVKGNSHILPILISIDEWKDDIDAQGEEIMEYGVRNIAQELILQNVVGNVIKDHDGNNLVLVYCQGDDTHVLKENCTEFINACNVHLLCSLCCYVGCPVLIDELLDMYKYVLEMEKSNLMQHDTVLFYEKENDAKGSKILPFPNFSDWAVLFEVGKKKELMNHIADFIRGVEAQGQTTESLKAFVYGIVNMIFSVLHKKKVSLEQVYGSVDILDAHQQMRSLSQIVTWAESLVDRGMDYLEKHEGNTTSIVRKAQQYVIKNLGDELTCEMIAKHVFLNPAYLSRLFKKDTSMSLASYIAHKRIEKTKELLIETNDKISTIAESVGYCHFSHFARMFKKTVGLSPQEYRKQYEKL